MKKKILSIVILVICLLNYPFTTIAQKNYPQIPYNWHATKTVNAYNDAHSYMMLEKASKLYFEDNTVIFPASDNEQAYLMKIDENGKILWKSTLAKDAAGLGKTPDNKHIIVFYYSDQKTGIRSDWTVIKEFSAAVFEINTGKKILEKVIFKNDIGKYIDIKFNTTTNGVFSNILIRQADFKGHDSPQAASKASTTETVNLLCITDNLEVVSNISLPSLVNGNLFLGCSANANADVFVSSYSDGGNLTCEQFNSKGSLIKKLTTTLPVRNDDKPQFALGVDPANNSSIFDLVKYKRSDKTFVDAVVHFDFTTGNVKVSKEHEHTKENGEKLEDDYKVRTGKDCSPIKHHYNEIEVIDIQVSGDKVVAVREVDYEMNTTSTLYLNRGAIILTVYDKNLENPFTIAISKNYYSYGFTYYSKPGVKLLNNAIYCVGTSGPPKKISVNYSFFDLETRKFTKVYHGEQEDNIERKYVDGEGTFWFKDHCLMQTIDLKNSLTIKPDKEGISLKRVDY